MVPLNFKLWLSLGYFDLFVLKTIIEKRYHHAGRKKLTLIIIMPIP